MVGTEFLASKTRIYTKARLRLACGYEIFMILLARVFDPGGLNPGGELKRVLVRVKRRWCALASLGSAVRVVRERTAELMVRLEPRERKLNG